MSVGRLPWGRSYREQMGYPEPDLLLRLNEDGVTYLELADLYGMTRSQVAGYVYRARQARKEKRRAA